MESWLQSNHIEIYSTQNERESLVAERFIRTLKSKIYKYMTSVWKNVYINKLDEIVNKCKKRYDSGIGADVKYNTYIGSDKH